MKTATMTIIAFAFFAISCNQPTRNQAETAKSESSCEKVEETICEIETLLQFPLIGNTIGFVTIFWTELFDNKADILNDDGTVWGFFYSNSDSFDVRTDNELFYPWASLFECGSVVMRCVAKSENYLTVVVNEEKNLVKRIRNNFFFETVEEHVTSVILSTDFEINPIRKYPSDDAPIVDLDSFDFQVEVLFAIERQGDWIRVEETLFGNGEFWVG